MKYVRDVGIDRNFSHIHGPIEALGRLIRL